MVVVMMMMQTLSVAGNRLTGLPEDFVGLRSLTSLSLAKNNLTKVFPEVFQLKQLKQLNLSINPSLEVPERFGELPNLQFLDLSECGIKSLSPAIGNATALTSLRLGTPPQQALCSHITSH
jgi:Leucine-rich repeat (LRR) protein